MSETILALAAGPIYVDFYTSPGLPLVGHQHPTLEPSRTGGWGRERGLGGSAAKFAAALASTPGGRSVLISRLPPDNTPEGCRTWEKIAFVDDPRWLGRELERTVRECPGLQLSVERETAPSEPGYTYHFKHPSHPLWPIASTESAATRSLGWSDVLAAWRALGKKAPGEVVVFLGGVLRTSLLQTLAAAIDGRDAETKALLAKAKLFIDFGRTDLREVVAAFAKEQAEAREEGRPVPTDADHPLLGPIRTCVRAAHTVMVDAITARDLDLYVGAHLPAKYLVVRPRGPLPGQWWLYKRKAAKDPEVVVRRPFDAPEGVPLPGTLGTESGRPTRVAALVRMLAHGEPPPPKTRWQVHVDRTRFKSVEHLTVDPDLRERLARLQKRVEMDAEFRHMLIVGPTGTGKEEVARWVHRVHPERHDRPFRSVSAGMLEGALVDSELFGHVANAFNGAVDRDGAFVTAKGSVLLINDLDALPMSTQAKLLDVLQDHEVKPVGSDSKVPVDVFLVVTTNVSPKELFREGKLRGDLYYRLASSYRLDLPRLRSRHGDAIAAARQGWDERNTRWSTGYELPKGFEDWLRDRSLVGNYRTVEIAVEIVHEHARGGGEFDESLIKRLDAIDVARPGRVPAQGTRGIIEAVNGLKEAIEKLGSGEAAGRDAGERPPSMKSSSPLFHALQKSAEERQLAEEPDPDRRLEEFLKLWLDTIDLHVGIDQTLTRREISACLDLGDWSVNDVLALLRRAMEPATGPHLEVVGAGRGAKWRAVHGTSTPS